MAMLESWRIGYAHLDYFRPVHWAAHSEDHGDCIVIEIANSDGVRGAAEAIMRPKWHEMTQPQIEQILVGGIFPALAKVDLDDRSAAAAALLPFREHGFACALVDQALWDMRASAADQPLWKLLGAAGPRVEVSFTLTRTQPEIMAREAAQMRERYGFRAFKVKTGQGIDIDRRAILEIRKAVGDDVTIMADSNRSHDVSLVRAMSDMLADAGVLYFEDPCAFTADASFVEAQSQSRLPILVDNQCRSFAAGRSFIQLGARALSLKTMKTGISESLELASLAQQVGVRVAVGISASAGAGAIHTLSLAAAMPREIVCLSCEETFFLYLKRDVLREPLKVDDGAIALPETSSIAANIDWSITQKEMAG